MGSMQTEQRPLELNIICERCMAVGVDTIFVVKYYMHVNRQKRCKTRCTKGV